jgi:calcium/calmodulin-dependent protein kinase I
MNNCRAAGHGKPVDIWAMGVITYYLLVGFTPFSRKDEEDELQAIEEQEDEAIDAIEKQEIRDLKEQKIQAIEEREEQSILAGDYKFEPGMFLIPSPTSALSDAERTEHWENVSQAAKDFVTACLTVDPMQRPTAAELLKHRWLVDERPHYVPDPGSPTGVPEDLLPHIRKRRDARKCCEFPVKSTSYKAFQLMQYQRAVRRAVWVIIAIKRMSMLALLASPGPSGDLIPHTQKRLDAGVRCECTVYFTSN